ncbi:MAG: M18 family aminopeptidase [Methylococcus sp.]|nr:M18 family aminopeptidase [Methylococcus sp.]
MNDNTTVDFSANARQLLDFIDQSPSPWHAGHSITARLLAAGFRCLEEGEVWTLEPGDRAFVVRGNSSVVAFTVGEGVLAKAGFRIVGAHTDSPGLRVKPRGAHAEGSMLRLGVEVYGGPILATFSDRDLSLAGRLCVRGEAGASVRLVCIPEALVRLPNLAIHMNREVNKDGLKFNKQTELPLLLAMADELPADERLRALLAAQADCEPKDILSWELSVFDTQPGAFWGPAREFIADSQLDNLASCHAGLSALLDADAPEAVAVAAFFDHEEIGSESHKGADGALLPDVLERIALALGLDRAGYKRALAGSFLISADMAHAYHPNFPQSYEPQHQVFVNKGPVIKTNACGRYATDAEAAARVIHLCEQAGVPYQQYVHRTDLGCGSTIGPMTAARLGISAADIGNPMWAMHSVRESSGVMDHTHMIALLRRFLSGGA